MDLCNKVISRFFVSSNKEQPLNASLEETICNSIDTNTGFEIIFSPENDICRLRDIYYDKSQSDISLCLNPLPQNSDCFPFNIENIQCELSLLKLAISVEANKRLRNMLINSDKYADLDEEVFVHRTCNNMVAWIMFFPPSGNGKSITLSQINNALEDKKIVYGINTELLNSLPENHDRYFKLYVAALGTPAVNGKDGYVVDHYPREIKNDIDVDELAQADYITLNLVLNIKCGDVICDIVPPTKGINGCTITGKTIPALNGSDPEIPKGRNTEISQDGLHLISTHIGHVEFSGNEFQVNPILDIEGNVNPLIGNINFLGDIHIHGDVCCGVSIRATGNIQVDGVIEACIIEAGKNIVVSSGIQGQNSAIIKAHKCVYAKYLENCKVYAKEDVYADCIIGCNIYSNGSIKATTGRGAIIGGTICSSKEVLANSIGSKTEKITSVLLGGLPCDDCERQEIIEELKELNLKIQKLETAPDTVQTRTEISKLKLKTYAARMKLEIIDKDLRNALNEQTIKDKRCLICDSAYPGTVVSIDFKEFHINRIEQNCKIGMLNGCVGRL